MTEPISSALVSVTAAGGITLFGMATGLDPSMLFAGACGGWWALSYMAPQSIIARLHHIALSSLIAAWIAPIVTGFIRSYEFSSLIPAGALRYAVALCAGLIAVPVLGRALTRIAKSRLRGAEGGASQ